MSEIRGPRHEHTPNSETLLPKHNPESPKSNEVHENVRHTVDTSRERADAARLTIENEQGISREQADAILSEQVQRDTTEVRWWSSELKAQTLDRTLASVRRRLSRPEKTLSKVIHQKTIEQVSDATGKTIARPSGILAGSICAFIGSLIAYLIARRIGGELSPSVGLVFFLGGFVIGIVGETIVYAVRKFYLRRLQS